MFEQRRVEDDFLFGRSDLLFEINDIFLDSLQDFASIVSFGQFFILGVKVFSDDILNLISVLVFILVAKENGLKSGDTID